MTLLIDIRMPNWMEDAALLARLRPLLPDVEILTGPQAGPRPDVTMLATVQMHADMADNLPGLQLVQKLGAGVETMLSNPNLPVSARVARLEPRIQAEEIAEYCLGGVLAYCRDFPRYFRQQSRAQWIDVAPRRLAEVSALVLGLGHIGSAIAGLLAKNGVRTLGWSRGPKTLDEVTTFHGPEGLETALSTADFIIGILPSTPQTRGLLNADTLAKTKRGAVIINAGRGDLIVDADLLAALETGQIGGAFLDVFNAEPLPKDHPFWTHDKIQITPHVSGFSIEDAIPDIAENYRRLMTGKPLLREIDREKGY